MRITLYTDYSLRVLMYVALKENQLATIGEIADTYNISKNHLMKVVQELAARDYLLAIRGKNGGMTLNRAPERINIGQLVRDMEQDLELVECFGDKSKCVLTPACKLKLALSTALDAFFTTLDNYTLADLVPGQDRSELSQLLGIRIEATNSGPTLDG